MQVAATPAVPFPSLPESLPSQTLHQPTKPTPLCDNADSPTPTIPDLPKNAYGLESFSDYCAAVDRVKAGFPAVEAVTPPDRSKPVIVHGIKFKIWDPHRTESDCSDTDSETTALHLGEVQNDHAKSTWSAGTPRRSILRQSTSSPLVRESDVPVLLPHEAQNQLVYNYASSASPSSRRTSRLSSRRMSIDAGVQSEPIEAQDDDEEVVRVAAARRASARRSSIALVRRGSVVHGLAGFTGVGRADSGAVICVANGKRFELIVDTGPRDDGNEIAVQCSGLEIDAEIEALFEEIRKEEVIEVDAEEETAETEDKAGEQTDTENCDQDVDMETNKTREESSKVPSPEQLRSNSVAFITPTVSALHNLEDLEDLEEISVTVPRESGRTTPAMLTPAHLSLRPDGQDLGREGIGGDEIVATTAHAANKRPILLSTSTPKVRVSAPPRFAVPERMSVGNEPEAKPEAQSPETAPPAVEFVEQLQQVPVHAMADPTNTQPLQPTTLDIVRQRSLSLKPSDIVPLVTQDDPSQTVQGRTLHLRAVGGVNIRPTASAYQLAAMATLSPKSYLRIVQPSQPRVVFAFASPGGTAPVGGVNVAPPHLMSTPPVATLSVAPDSLARASLAAAPRRSHVSIPRTGLSTPSQDLRPVNGVRQRAGSSAITPHVDLETETLVTPAPLQNNAQKPGAVPLTSLRTGSTLHTKPKNTSSSRAGSEANKASSSTVRPQDINERQVDFVDDGDDDFDAPAEMDDSFDVLPEVSDDAVEIAAEIHPEPNIESKDEIRPQSMKSRSRKASIASSRSRASRKAQQSSGSERRRMSSVTQVVKGTPDRSNDVAFSIDNLEDEREIEDLEGAIEEKEVSKKKKKPSRKAKSKKQAKKDGHKTTKGRGQKRSRELQTLPSDQVNLNDTGEEGGLRRSKRQRFPRLKFWKNETVSYERRLSQAIPTIAEVIVEVGGSEESDDDTWFGRR